MTGKPKKILSIDDTPSIRLILRIFLQARGFEFYEAGTAEDGLQLCNDVKPDLVILDLGLPDRDGLNILPNIKGVALTPSKVLILSMRKELGTKEQAFILGADAYATKPFLMEDIIEVIERQL